MKHNWTITAILVLFFLISQYVGLFVTYNYIDQDKTKASGEVTFKPLPYNLERPPKQNVLPTILFAILAGTILLLILIKFKIHTVWKWWFLLAVVFCLTISFSSVLNTKIALALGILLAVWKVFRPNLYIHNLTEIFIYGALAAIFVDILSLTQVIILLLIISVYDMIAVWKIKHMVTLAEFQTQTNLFAGLHIPYQKSAESNMQETQQKVVVAKAPSASLKVKKDGKKEKSKISIDKIPKPPLFPVQHAVLGGGDIGFPLLFAGVIMKESGTLNSLIIPLTTGVALSLLLLYSKPGRYYPAMPFLTMGCLVGWGITLLL